MGNERLLEAKKMVDENYKYFTSNIDELCKKYYSKYIVIKNCKVLNSYKNFDDAYTETLKTEKLGTFLIQHCVKNENEDLNYFYSNNVIFTGIL